MSDLQNKSPRFSCPLIARKSEKPPWKGQKPLSSFPSYARYFPYIQAPQ